jgi:serine/alanine adding enzyme
MSLHIVRTLPEDEWRRFVQDHPRGNVFHTPEMFEVFHRTRGHRPELWAARTPGKILALLLPVQITVFGNIFVPFTTRAVVYGGPLCLPGLEGRQALESLLQAYTHEAPRKPLFTEMRNISDLGDLQAILETSGFAYENHLNFLIDLNRPAEAILNNIGRRTRKHIRHGLNRGLIKIREAKSPEQKAACYDLLRKTYQRAGIPLADRSLFEAAHDVLDNKDMIRFTAAYIDGEAVACSVELLYKDVAYGWYGGLDRKFRSYSPNEMLVWNILEWASRNGFRTYDFGGAGRPGENYGVRNFKAKFRGTQVDFGRNICIHYPRLFPMSKIGYGLYRRCMSHSPRLIQHVL